jgi:Tat protein secretion system quality control protein TatD with DNase activity
VPFIAKKVSELKEVPLGQVLQAARDNTKRMYGV